MASLFKRLFSSGGTQTATVQVEEQPAESSAEEKTVSQDGIESRAGEQSPSQEELNKFLYENFLDGAKPVEIPQTQEWAAASAPVVFENPASVNLREALELSSEDAISENDEASVEVVAEVTADASLEGGGVRARESNFCAGRCRVSAASRSRAPSHAGILDGK